MQMNQKIIHLDVFRFHFEEELGNYMYDFLTKDRKLRHGGHINLTKISLEIHNVGITAMKDNSDYL
jgi:hypothetical protein